MSESVWAADLVAVDGPDQPLPADADTVIIGAGYTGLNAARELARAGQRVVVVDKEAIGTGASGINFGSVALGLAASPSALAARHGEAFARRAALLSQTVLAEFCALIEREAIDCELHRSGHITVALNRGQMARLASTKAGWDRFAEHRIVLLSKDEALQSLDAPRVRGGLLNPDSYTIHPAKYLAGLVRAAVRAGVTIIQRTAVSEVRRAGTERFETLCGTAAIRSKHVVVCTDGVRLPGFKPSRRGIVPIHSYMIATEPLSGEQSRAISRHAFATGHAVPDYFRRTPDDRLLFGSRKNLEKPSPSGDEAALVARMHEVLPFTKGLRVTHSWNGPLGLTADRLPHVGIADGIHYALGYCGKGIPWSAHCGLATADLVRGVRTPDPVIAMPVPQPRLGRGSAWFLKPLSWYYRTRDAWAELTTRGEA
ncbi:MAG TPA: FAD-binding oxidoreductase [Thermoanaerobaculia bacterium]|nr:FAD-binding oxidoreductase [Thermoanaerobaculia bacterium]